MDLLNSLLVGKAPLSVRRRSFELPPPSELNTAALVHSRQQHESELGRDRVVFDPDAHDRWINGPRTERKALDVDGPEDFGGSDYE